MKITLELDVKTVLRWALTALLVWAALSKVANLHEFYLSLLAYKLPLPGALIRLTTTVLPWLELLCGVLLVTGTLRRAALLWAGILFAVFVLATGQAWVRGLDIGCGCFKLDLLGLDAQSGMGKFFESAPFAFFRALLLLGGAVYLFRAESRARTG